MPKRLQLEVFQLADLADDRLDLGQAEYEEARLASYELGYTAGWDDAAAAQSEDVARLRGVLGRNLEDLSFTYQEAHSHVLRSLEPLLRDMVSKVLPAIARETLGSIVLEQLTPLARSLADRPVEIVTNAANLPLLNDLLAGATPFPLAFVEEPSLGDGQVYLRLDGSESRVDLDGVIAAITAAVSAFFSVRSTEEQSYG